MFDNRFAWSPTLTNTLLMKHSWWIPQIFKLVTCTLLIELRNNLSREQQMPRTDLRIQMQRQRNVHRFKIHMRWLRWLPGLEWRSQLYKKHARYKTKNDCGNLRATIFGYPPSISISTLFILTLTSGKECGKDMFKCLEFAECIPQMFVCDGEPDCLDKTDEEGCGKN